MKRSLSQIAPTASCAATISKKMKGKADGKQFAGVCLYYDKSIFLVQPTGSSGFGIPKGLVEKGESLEAAARREFSEETGIDISELDLEYLDGSASIRNGKKIHTFIGRGDGTEKFIESNLILEGFRAGQPENSSGRYFKLKEAAEVIHKNQANLLKSIVSHFNSS